MAKKRRSGAISAKDPAKKAEPSVLAAAKKAKPTMPEQTIAAFEGGFSGSTPRKSLADIKVIDPGLIAQINHNDILKPLNATELLFYSTEYRESAAKALSKVKSARNALDQCSPTITLNKSLSSALSSIDKDISTCSELGKAFLTASATMLAASKNLYKEGKIDASFEGLSIEAIPCYSKNHGRSDNYQYTSQQVQICFQELPAPLTASNRPMVILAHEFTHAIDDIYTKLRSARVLFENLNRNAPSNVGTQTKILECAAALVDDSADTLTKGYLPEFLKYISKKSEEGTTLVSEWAEYARDKDMPFQESNGSMTCTSVPTEFLTFNMEHIFNSLNASSSPDEFQTKYQEVVEASLKKISKYAPDVQAAALELIKDTTKVHLDLISDKTPSADLQRCCDIVDDILSKAHAARTLVPPSLSSSVATAPSSSSSISSVAPPIALSASSLRKHNVDAIAVESETNSRGTTIRESAVSLVNPSALKKAKELLKKIGPI